MVDPTSDLNENVSEDEASECATCDSLVIDNPTHRVITWIEDGAVQSAHFCDDNCRRKWTEE